MRKTVTLEDAITTASCLPPDQQEMLVEILHHRYSDTRRQEMAKDVQQALDKFRKGQFNSLSAEDALTDMHQYLAKDE